MDEWTVASPDWHEPTVQLAGRYICMVVSMERRKVTLVLQTSTLDAVRTVAPSGNLSGFADRALRNEALRAQLAVRLLPELSGWLDDAEQDRAGAA
jgi:hypothetical protein